MPHLTMEQRYQIHAEMATDLKKSQQEIADRVGVSQSAISREFRRNKGQESYFPGEAQIKSAERRRKANSIRQKKISYIIPLVDFILCNYKWSPDQISKWIKQQVNVSISYESIYQHIWADKKNGGKLYKSLRRRGKKYNKRGSKLAGRGLIPNRVGIEQRPMVVDQKQRVGDFEGDTIVGKNHKGSILTVVDRVSKLTRLKLLSGPKSKEAAEAIIEILNPIKDLVLTITTDNGKEFAAHEAVAATLDVEFYFAQPYHSWERGLNENTNGLIRQYFPKGCDFIELTDDDVSFVENQLNNRPRKTLEYRTPNQEFLRLTGIDPNYAFRT